MSDVCVAGATATGVAAALDAPDAGASVSLVHRGRHVPERDVGGLSWTDVAESILRGLLDGIEVVLGSGDPPETAVCVDSTCEGDRLPRPGVPYRVRREAVAPPDERWAGRQPAARPGMPRRPHAALRQGGRVLSL